MSGYTVIKYVIASRFRVIKYERMYDSMQFCHVTLSVKNLEESLCFYQDILGLPLNKRFVAGAGTEIAFLGSGETEIELICHQAHKDIAIGQDISLGFAVSSVQETMSFLHKKGIETGEIIQHPHTKFFFTADPNGVKIQLIETF